MSESVELATSRVPVTPTVHNRLREFRNGLNVSYSEAIALLLDLVLTEQEDDYMAGRRLRVESDPHV